MNGDADAGNDRKAIGNHAPAAPLVRGCAMIRVFREPEVVVRSGGDSIVSSVAQWGICDLAEAIRIEQPAMDSFWLIRPRMNGYNVHDGLSEEGTVVG
jgi:hypothetical protein